MYRLQVRAYRRDWNSVRSDGRFREWTEAMDGDCETRREYGTDQSQGTVGYGRSTGTSRLNGYGSRSILYQCCVGWVYNVVGFVTRLIHRTVISWYLVASSDSELVMTPPVSWFIRSERVSEREKRMSQGKKWMGCDGIRLIDSIDKSREKTACLFFQKTIEESGRKWRMVPEEWISRMIRGGWFTN